MKGNEIFLKIINQEYFEENIVKPSANIITKLPAREGNRYQVVSLMDGEEVPVHQNLIIMQSDNDLVIIAEDDAIVHIKDYFELAEQNHVSFELFSITGYVDDLLNEKNAISVDNDDVFYYAQGNKSQLLEMIQDNADFIHIIDEQELYENISNNILTLNDNYDYLPMGGLLAGAVVALGAGSALGGGGGGDSEVVFSISGLFTGGPAIEDNDLMAYVFDKDGREIAGDIKVNDDGSYSISISENISGPILLQIRSTQSGFDYIDEATNEEVNLSTSFRAIAYANGRDLIINTNAITEMAVRYMLDDNGLTSKWITTSNDDDAKELAKELAGHTEQSISQTYQNLAEAFGLIGINLLSLNPIATNDDAFLESDQNAQDYGRVLAALSALEQVYGYSTTNVLNDIIEGLNGNEFDTEQFSMLLQGATEIDNTDYNANGNEDFFDEIQDIEILNIQIRDEDNEVIADSIITDSINTITATLTTGLTDELRLYGRVESGEWEDISSFVTGPDLIWTNVALSEGEHRLELVITTDGLPPEDDGSNLFADISKETYTLDSILPEVESATLHIKPEEDEDDEDEDDENEEEDYGELLETITDESVGTTVIFKIVFTEEMDTNYYPIIEQNTDAFVYTGVRAWSDDGKTFTIEYRLSDGDEDVTEITFDISNVRDLLGNEIQESTTISLNGIIDTLNPEVPVINYQATSDTTPTVSGFLGELDTSASLTVRISDQIFENVEVAEDGSWSVDVTEPLSEGIYDVIAIVKDENGNETSSDVNEINDLYIGNGPRIEISSSDDDILNINEGFFTFTFTFSEDVNGFSENDIEITNGIKDNFIQVSDSVYTIRVTPDEESSGEVVVTIRDNAATSISSGLVNAPLNSYKQEYDFDSPAVTDVIIVGIDADGEEKDDALIEGDIIRVELTMSESIIIDLNNSIPTFVINLDGTDRVVTYNEEASDDNKLVFLYTIVEGDKAIGGIRASQNQLALNGATLLDEAGNQAEIDTPSENPSNNHIIVDTSAPEIRHITIKGIDANGVPKSSALISGDLVRIEILMDEETFVDTSAGAPTYTINIGGVERVANYISGSGSTSLVFSYTVVESDDDSNGISARSNSFDLNGAIIKDELDHEADSISSNAVLANQNNILVGQQPEIHYISFEITNNNQIILSFNQVLNAESLPDIDTFTLYVDDDGRTITNVDIQGRNVTLTYDGELIIDSSDSSSQKVEVKYEKPTSGNVLENESSQEVGNLNVIKGTNDEDDLIGTDGEIDIFDFNRTQDDDDHIINFSFSDGDKIDLSDLLTFESDNIGHDITSFIEVDDRGNGQDVELSVHPSGRSFSLEIVLEGIGTGSLTLDDFVEHIII